MKAKNKKYKEAVQQKWKCANYPNSNLQFIDNYKCPLYIISDGTFDESCWKLSTDNIGNSHALCPSCHNVKKINLSIYHHELKQNNIDIIKNIK